MKLRLSAVACMIFLAACQPEPSQDTDSVPTAVATQPAQAPPQVAELPDVIFETQLLPRRRSDYTNPSGDHRWHLVFDYTGGATGQVLEQASRALRDAGYTVKPLRGGEGVIFSRKDLKRGSLRVVSADNATERGHFIINMPYTKTQ